MNRRGFLTGVAAAPLGMGAERAEPVVPASNEILPCMDLSFVVQVDRNEVERIVVANLKEQIRKSAAKAVEQARRVTK